MNNSPLPRWITPDAIALRDGLLFQVRKVQRDRSSGALLLWDGAEQHPLDECRPALLGDLQEARTFVCGGKALLLEPQASGVIAISDERHRAFVQLPTEAQPLEVAAQSLAAFFDGVALPPEPLEVPACNN